MLFSFEVILKSSKLEFNELMNTQDSQLFCITSSMSVPLTRSCVYGSLFFYPPVDVEIAQGLHSIKNCYDAVDLLLFSGRPCCFLVREWLPWFALIVNGFGNKIIQTSKSESEHSLRM